MVYNSYSRSLIRTLGLGLVLGIVGVQGIRGQPADAVIEPGTRLLALDQPQALVADPLEEGFFYIVEGGKHRVLRVDAQGTVVQTIGGPGSREGQFDAPQALDATNGTTLLVADTENGRIQGFARTGAFLFSIPVGPNAGDSQRSYSENTAEVSSIAEGRPLAIAVNDADDVFVIDALDGIIRWWDRDYRVQEPIGGYVARDGSLTEPTAFALDNDQNLYVLDEEHQSIMLFDALGTFLRRMGEGIVQGGHNLRISDNYLWVVRPRQLLVFEIGGSLFRVFDVEEGAGLVDVYTQEGQLWLLKEDGFYQTNLPIKLD